eukprot:scaffold8832_cov128-Skeletonema_marinoi.AAC.7
MMHTVRIPPSCLEFHQKPDKKLLPIECQQFTKRSLVLLSPSACIILYGLNTTVISTEVPAVNSNKRKAHQLSSAN